MNDDKKCSRCGVNLKGNIGEIGGKDGSFCLDCFEMEVKMMKPIGKVTFEKQVHRYCVSLRNKIKVEDKQQLKKQLKHERERVELYDGKVRTTSEKRVKEIEEQLKNPPKPPVELEELKYWERGINKYLGEGCRK